MKLVIDANVGLSALLPEIHSAQAQQLLSDFRKGIHQLIAPGLYFVEVGNVLVHKAKVGLIPKTDLPLLSQELFRRQPIIVPTVSQFHRAYAIAADIRVSVYDAIYLSLSQQEGCPLVTDDQKLIKAATGFSTIPLSYF